MCKYVAQTLFFLPKDTFWESVPGGCCGASEEGHNKLIAAWKSSWESRGWETRVLTMDDAKRHPDFDKLEEILQQLEVNDYNRRCFYRWLAMSVVGGGKMGYFITNFYITHIFNEFECNRMDE